MVSETRKLALESVVRDVFRGRADRVTPARLTDLPSAAASLFAPLRRPAAEFDAARAELGLIMDYMDFIVRLFTPDNAIAASDPSGQTFFGAIVSRATALVRRQMVPASVVAQFFEQQLEAVAEDFRQFHAGARLLRPLYSVSYLSGVEAERVLESIRSTNTASKDEMSSLVASSVANYFSQAGWAGATPPVPPAASLLSAVAPPWPPPAPILVPAAPPAGLSKRQAKRARQVAAAAAAAATVPAGVAPAVAPVVAPVAPVVVAPAPPVPPPQPPAAPAPSAPAVPKAAPAVNQLGVIGGAAFTGSANFQIMHAFSSINLDASGKERCFNFWRRGVCRTGVNCRFSHV
jgi:hypothetical protein